MILKTSKQIQLIKDIAKKYHWEYIKQTDELIIFWNYYIDREKDNLGRPLRRDRSTRIQLILYKSNGVVITTMKHPVQGKTSLIRRNLMLNELEDVFENPRLHTRKGKVISS